MTSLERVLERFIDKFQNLDWTTSKFGNKIFMTGVIHLGDDYEVFTKNNNKRWMRELFEMCESFEIKPLKESKSVEISFYVNQMVVDAL